MIRDGMIETGPEQVGDGLSGVGGDPGFELFEIVSHGLALLAGVNPAHSLELEPEPAAGKMNAEDVENGCPGEDGQLGPDGQKSLCLAQQPAGPGIGSLPGDVATEVEHRPSRRAARARIRSSIASAGGRSRRKDISDWA